jgi:hypothetical protein
MADLNFSAIALATMSMLTRQDSRLWLQGVDAVSLG